MTENLADEFQCPICIETLQRPIRILACGHNFCHGCLARFCQSNRDKRCPTCRSPIAFPGNGVDGMSRNITLENVIERLGKMKVISQPAKIEDCIPSTMKQLRNSAATYQQQNNFQKAVETLQIIIDHVKGWDKLQPSIDQAECLLSLENIPEAEVACVAIASIVDANQSSHLTYQSRDVYDENIKKLISSFIDVKEFDCAISLVGCRFQFLKNHDVGECRLIKLENIGALMAEISFSRSKQNKQEQIKDQYPIMEKILDFMQKIKDAELNIKCKYVAWFLVSFGACCIDAADYDKSIAKNESAITLLKTVFDVEASQYWMFGICHNNTGVAFKNTNQFFKAKIFFTKAIEIYNTANDWLSVEKKSREVSTSTNHLNEVERKILQNLS